MNRIKQLHRQSQQIPRPWVEVFGLGQDELEQRWFEAIKAMESPHEADVALIVKLRASRAESPCVEAQRIAAARLAKPPGNP